MNAGIKERDYRNQERDLRAMSRRDKCEYVERHGLDRFVKLVRETYEGKAKEGPWQT